MKITKEQLEFLSNTVEQLRKQEDEQVLSNEVSNKEVKEVAEEQPQNDNLQTGKSAGSEVETFRNWGGTDEGTNTNRGLYQKVRIGTPPSGTGASESVDMLNNKSVEWLSANLDKVNQLISD